MYACSINFMFLSSSGRQLHQLFLFHGARTELSSKFRFLVLYRWHSPGFSSRFLDTVRQYFNFFLNPAISHCFLRKYNHCSNVISPKFNFNRMSLSTLWTPTSLWNELNKIMDYFAYRCEHYLNAEWLDRLTSRVVKSRLLCISARCLCFFFYNRLLHTRFMRLLMRQSHLLRNNFPNCPTW